MHKKLSKKVLIAVLSAAMVFSTPVAMINYNQITTYAQENESVVESAVIEKGKPTIMKITLKDKAEFAKKDGGESYTADDLKDAITIDVNKGSSYEGEQNTIGKENIQLVTFDSDKIITITVKNENKFISSDDIQVNFKEGYLVKSADTENEKTPITFKKNVTNNLEPAKEADKIKNGFIDKDKITLTLVDGIKIKYHLRGGDDNENGEKLVNSFTLSGFLDDTIKPTEAKVNK